jgi:hypothetical protein
VSPLLYLDQNYLSGIAKHKPAFHELEPVLREAVARGVVTVAESAVHERESRPRPDLRLLELLRELSGGRRLPTEPDPAARDVRRRMLWTTPPDRAEAVARDHARRRVRAWQSTRPTQRRSARAHGRIRSCTVAPIGSDVDDSFVAIRVVRFRVRGS